MTLRVIGAGVGRTGTMSLKLALEKLLGAPCYHMIEVFPRPPHFGVWTAAGRGEPVDWHALLHGFAAAVDWPASAFWEPISKAFPKSIIVLSTRSSSDAWWKSASDTIFAGRTTPSPAMQAMLESVVGSRFRSREAAAAIAAYEEHNAHVRATAPRDRFVDWTVKDGWAPLCEALKLPIPDEPFPHVNTTEEFKARLPFSGPPAQ